MVDGNFDKFQTRLNRNSSFLTSYLTPYFIKMSNSPKWTTFCGMSGNAHDPNVNTTLFYVENICVKDC